MGLLLQPATQGGRPGAAFVVRPEGCATFRPLANVAFCMPFVWAAPPQAGPRRLVRVAMVMWVRSSVSVLVVESVADECVQSELEKNGGAELNESYPVGCFLRLPPWVIPAGILAVVSWPRCPCRRVASGGVGTPVCRLQMGHAECVVAVAAADAG